MQGVIAGGATSAELNVLDAEADNNAVRVESIYIFPSRAALEAYFAGPAVALREDGKARFVDTKKATFTRRIGEIVFQL